MSETQSSGSALTDLIFGESESMDENKSQEIQRFLSTWKIIKMNRLFYSKCLAIKLKFTSQDSAQLVPIALIFQVY